MELNIYNEDDIYKSLNIFLIFNIYNRTHTARERDVDLYRFVSFSSFSYSGFTSLLHLDYYI